MPLVAMNREMGSLGRDVAAGLEEALGMKVRHHEMIDHLADRARMRKSHVISFLEGTQDLFERLTTDQVRLRILTADEILSAAGHVELHGTVDYVEQSEACSDIARRIRGARVIENHLHIAETGASGRE